MRKDGGLAPSSNQAYKLTPQSGPKIVPILKAESGPTAFPLYRGGADTLCQPPDSVKRYANLPAPNLPFGPLSEHPSSR